MKDVTTTRIIYEGEGLSSGALRRETNLRKEVSRAVKDQHKTKAQLVKELAELREPIAELETAASEGKGA